MGSCVYMCVCVCLGVCVHVCVYRGCSGGSKGDRVFKPPHRFLFACQSENSHGLATEPPR